MLAESQLNSKINIFRQTNSSWNFINLFKRETSMQNQSKSKHEKRNAYERNILNNKTNYHIFAACFRK
jgi:hypothetical protein